MGALASVLTIWVITGVLVYMAVMRIVENKYEIDAVYMLITAGLGVLVNIVCVCPAYTHTHLQYGTGVALLRRWTPALARWYESWSQSCTHAVCFFITHKV
jgi:Co/Zn/Cd efflux system component